MSRIIPFLSASTGLSESDVSGIIFRAPSSYKHYLIPKRSGGERLISQPAREVKSLQRILAGALARLPIHDSAMAYRSGISIADNAARHAGSGPIMKFDFKEFFPSLRAVDWLNYCKRFSVFSEQEDIELSGRLFFHHAPKSSLLTLAIGAPSSPWLSNVLMYEFDDLISRAVASDKVIYTRYADDLTFSAPRTGFLNRVEKILSETVTGLSSPRLRINPDKSVVATKKYRRVVTGLVLANDGRVTLGRDRKRKIRAGLYNALAGQNTGEQNARLAGWLAFAGDVEPAYLEAVKARYGKDILIRLTRSLSDSRSEHS